MALAHIILAAFIALALTGAAAADVPPTPPIVEPATETATEALPTDLIALEIERYRRMTVPVTIMDQGPFRFLIDTGAQATVLSLTLADRLQLDERKPATVIAMSSQRRVMTARVPDLTLGSRTFTVRTAPLLDAANFGEADGILGMDSLQDQRVLIDFEHGTIAVSDARDRGGDRGFDIVVRAQRRLGQLIITSARLDGVTTAIIVDTGSQGSVGNLALQDRLRRARELGTGTMTDVNGVRASGIYRLARKLDLGDARLSNFPVVYTDSPTFRALGLEDEPALILGIAELRLFKRVAIDFKTRRILFDLPAGALMPVTSAFIRR